MNVNHLNFNLSGGAAIAAERLHESLLRSGVDSRFWCSNRAFDETRRSSSCAPIQWGIDTGGIGKRFKQWLTYPIRRLGLRITQRRAMRGRPPGLEVFTTPRRPTATPCPGTILQGDILQLHWVAKMIDYESFFASIPDDFPIVWTLHDMNPFTGGCHYSDGCERFSSVCEHCPQLANPGPHDLSNQSFFEKLHALKGKNLHVVAPSRWLTREATRSRVFSGAKSFHTIPYGLDLATYRPMDRSEARRMFNLPDDAFIVGFGAFALGLRRKGLQHLLDALKIVKAKSQRPIAGLVFGAGPTDCQSPDLPQIYSAGIVNEPEKIAAVYSAMDIVVVPSTEDNLPNIGLEALACGRPVVGFAVGGIPDYVLPMETGLLARPRDSEDLAQQILWLLSHDEQSIQFGRNARAFALREFRYAVQAQRYIELYNSVLSDRSQAEQRNAA